MLNTVATHFAKLCNPAPLDNSDFGKVPNTRPEIGINVKITPTPKRIFGKIINPNDVIKVKFV